MRIGELLVAARLVTPQEVDIALRTQAAYGGRVGSILAEQGYVDVDAVGAQLGRQQGVPFVTAGHLASIDPSVLAKLPRKAAERYLAVPVGLTPSHQLRVALASPNDLAAVEALQVVAGMRLSVHVAPELLLRRAIERYYAVPPSDARFIRMDTPTAVERSPSPPPASVRERVQAIVLSMPESPARPTPPPSAPRIAPPPRVPSIDFGAPPMHERAAPDARPTPQPHPRTEPPPAFRPRSVPPEPTVHFAVTGAPTRPLTARPPADGSAYHVTSVTPERLVPRSRPPEASVESVSAPRSRAPKPVYDVDEACVRIAESVTTQGVGNALAGYLRRTYACGLVMVVRDGAAIGWRGFVPGLDDEALEAIAIPLSTRSIVQAAHDERRAVFDRGEDAAMKRLMMLLRVGPVAEIAVAPVAVGERVINLVLGAAEHALARGAQRELDRVVVAAADAYARLLHRAR